MPTRGATLSAERPVIGKGVVRHHFGEETAAQDQGTILKRPFEFDLVVGAKRAGVQLIIQFRVLLVARRNGTFAWRDDRNQFALGFSEIEREQQEGTGTNHGYDQSKIKREGRTRRRQ